MKRKIQTTVLITTILTIFFVINAYSYLSTQKKQKQQCAFSESGVDYKKAVDLAKAMQNALRSDDKKSVADFVDYPLRVGKIMHYPNDKYIQYYINTKEQFIEKYDSIFTDEVIEALKKADPTDIFCNYKGGAIAGGYIWILGDPPKIVSVIN